MNKILHSSMILILVAVFFACKNNPRKKTLTQDIRNNTVNGQALKEVIINESEIKEYNNLMNLLVSKRLISTSKIIVDTINLVNHPLVRKFIKRDILDKSTINGKVLTGNIYCYNSDIQNKFQVFYFINEEEAIEVYTIFKTWVNSSSFFEKPYKLFFRFKNKIFYVTSDSNLTCSGIVIESLAQYFDYKVDYFKKYYPSGNNR